MREQLDIFAFGEDPITSEELEITSVEELEDVPERLTDSSELDAIEIDKEEEEVIEYYIQEHSKSKLKKTPLPKHPPKNWEEFCIQWRMFIKRIINQHKIFAEEEKDLLNLIILEFMERRNSVQSVELPKEIILKIKKHPVNIYMKYSEEDGELTMEGKIEAHDIEEIKEWLQYPELDALLDKMFHVTRPYFDKFDASKGKFQSFLYSFVSKRAMRQWTRENKDKVKHSVKLIEECEDGVAVLSNDEEVETSELKKTQLEIIKDILRTKGDRKMVMINREIRERSLYKIFELLEKGYTAYEMGVFMGTHEGYIVERIKELRTIPEVIILKSMCK